MYPCINAFYVSLFDWNGISKLTDFVGLQNFVELFKDLIFYRALYNNLYFLIISLVVTMCISMFFAVILARKQFREKNFYRTVFLFPDYLPVVVMGILWMLVYSANFGLLDSILKAVGLESWIRVWLGDKGVILPALTVIMVWSQIGFNMVLFLAGFMNIPVSLYEAAGMDGARELYITFRITIPLIWEIVRTALVFFIVTAFTFYFQIILLITRGGPDRRSEVLGTYLYDRAFGSHRFGYGTAIGVVLFAITMVLVLIVLRGTEKEVHEY